MSVKLFLRYLVPVRRVRFGVIKIKFLITVFSLSFLSCAYFNMYYNARKYFNLAYQETRKNSTGAPNTTETTNYQKTIEKCSRLIEYYPTSRWVDDALMLIGRSFYYKHEYRLALRKFQELIDNFPESSYLPTAQVWEARCWIALQDYQQALDHLGKLSQIGGGKKGKAEIHFEAGRAYYFITDYPNAEKEFSQVIELRPEKDLLIDAFQWQIKSLLELKDYENASKSLVRVIKFNLDRISRFEFQLQLARVTKLKGNPERSIEQLSLMRKKEKNTKNLAPIRLEQADALDHAKKFEQAIAEYKSIITDYPKTEEAATAYFQVGKIYEEQLIQLSNAKENYDKVKIEFGTAKEITESNYRSLRIDQLAQTRQDVQKSEKEYQEKYEKSKKDTIPNNDPDPADIIKKQFKLAEQYLFVMQLPDSAYRIYTWMVEKYTRHSLLDRAIYSIVYLRETFYHDTTQSNQSYQKLIQDYPNSPYTLGVRNKLKLPIPDRVDSLTIVRDQYRKAEDKWLLGQDIDGAIHDYQEIILTAPKTDLAAQAQYAIGWILENKKQDYQNAKAAYDSLVKKYPSSSYSQSVLARVTLAKTTLADTSKIRQKNVKPPTESGEAVSEGKEDIRDRLRRRQISIQRESERQGQKENQPPKPGNENP